MSLKSCSKVFLLLVSVAFVSHYAYNYFNGKKKKPKQFSRKEVHEVIMFSQRSNELKRSKYSRCMITSSMERLLHHINSTQHTLDICMYVLTNLDLVNAILKLNYRNVKIRLIIDADMAFSSGSCLKRFEKQGIPVRWMKSTNLMHHKFCLIDASSEDQMVTPLVLTGSLNWTNQAISGNWENVAVTSQTELIRQYQEEFEKLWVMFTPIVDLI